MSHKSLNNDNNTLTNDKYLITVENMNKQGNRSILRSSTTFLQVVVILIGIATLALLLIEPHFEGRNAHASLFQIYFNDPFLAYVYIGSIPFFVALTHAFKLLEYIRQNKAFSQAAVNALRIIKYCAFITAGLIMSVIAYLRIVAFSSSDDPAGAIILGNILTLASILIGATAGVLQKTLQGAVRAKSENDLTV